MTKKSLFSKFLTVFNLISILAGGFILLTNSGATAIAHNPDELITVLQEKKELQDELSEQRDINVELQSKVNTLEENLWIYTSQMEHLELMIGEMTEEINSK